MAEVQRHLRSYVVNEVFRGQDPPSPTRRRYYPTDSDIRNILNAVRTGQRKASDDQTSLEIKCKEWKDEHRQDFVYFRVSQQLSFHFGFFPWRCFWGRANCG